MKKSTEFKLIKEYPGSPPVGTVFTRIPRSGDPSCDVFQAEYEEDGKRKILHLKESAVVDQKEYFKPEVEIIGFEIRFLTTDGTRVFQSNEVKKVGKDSYEFVFPSGMKMNYTSCDGEIKI